MPSRRLIGIVSCSSRLFKRSSTSTAQKGTLKLQAILESPADARQVKLRSATCITLQFVQCKNFQGQSRRSLVARKTAGQQCARVSRKAAGRQHQPHRQILPCKTSIVNGQARQASSCRRAKTSRKKQFPPSPNTLFCLLVEIASLYSVLAYNSKRKSASRCWLPTLWSSPVVTSLPPSALTPPRIAPLERAKPRLSASRLVSAPVRP